MEIGNVGIVDDGMNNRNTGGYLPVVYAIKVSDIVGVEYPTNPTNPEDILKIDFNDISFTGNLNKLTCQEGSVMLDSAEVGETDGAAYNNELSFKLSGNTPENVGIKAALGNAHLLFFVIEETGGYVRCLGTNERPARRVAGDGAKSGAKVEEYKHVAFKFGCPSSRPAAFITNCTKDDLDAAIGSGS